MPIGVVVGLLITRLVITHFGEAAYGQYGLLVGLGSLLPFADLGLSAAILNAVASTRTPGQDQRVRLTMVSAFRLMAISAVVIGLIAATITVLGGWRVLLGKGLDFGNGSLAAGVCLALIGINVPFGVGQRILNGLSRNHVTIVLNALNRPLVLAAVATVVVLDLPVGGFVAVFAYAAALLLGVATTVVAARHIRPAVGVAVRDALRVRTVRGAKVFDVAWPMLLQMIALPLAMQSDRIVLSHFSDLAALNQYNFAMQLFTPITLVLSSAGVTLWSVFAGQRAGISQRKASPHRMAAVFGAVAALAVICVAALSPILSDVATDGRITLPWLLMAAFSAFVIARGANQPLGMYLTDGRGLRFQALMIVAMLPLNLGLSIALAGPLGASGPILGSAAGVLLCQTVPNWIFVRWLRRKEHHPASSVSPEPTS